MRLHSSLSLIPRVNDLKLKPGSATANKAELVTTGLPQYEIKKAGLAEGLSFGSPAISSSRSVAFRPLLAKDSAFSGKRVSSYIVIKKFIFCQGASKYKRKISNNMVLHNAPWVKAWYRKKDESERLRSENNSALSAPVMAPPANPADRCCRRGRNSKRDPGHSAASGAEEQLVQKSC